MIRKISMLVLIAGTVQGAERPQKVSLLTLGIKEFYARENAAAAPTKNDERRSHVRQRSGSLPDIAIPGITCVTPLSPMLPVIAPDDMPLQRRLMLNSIKDEVRCGARAIKTGIESFINAIDYNDAQRVAQLARPALLRGQYSGRWCKQPAILRALSRGRLDAFATLIDCRAELYTPDEDMFTVDMYVYMYYLHGKYTPSRILSDRNINLTRIIPYDNNNRNALWHLINHKIMPDDTKEYEVLLFKINALRNYGVSAKESDATGISALDLARKIYGEQSEVVAALQ